METPTLCKVPVDGGDSVQLTEYHSEFLAASPIDGQIAYTYVDEQANPKRGRVALVPLEGGAPTKIFDFPSPYGRKINWSVDGEALTFIETRSGVSNIWKLPVDGSRQTQITDFKSDLIFTYDWSRWNKDFAAARGSRSSDVVLIRDMGEQY
jgi:Tol biopolymer transport system component